MKKARNGFIKNLRYLCLIGVIALGLMTIVGTGGGGGGGGDDVVDVVDGDDIVDDGDVVDGDDVDDGDVVDGDDIVDDGDVVDGDVTVSTDATANIDLITSFTGSNSVTVSGTWTNETFASTGDVSVNISFDTSTNVVTIIWDIDGNVYGGSDPDPETFTIEMTDLISNGTATLTATSITYGDISVTLTYNTDGTGSFTGTAENEPTGAVENASFSGTFELDGGTVTFTVENSTFVYFGIPITCSNNVSATLN